MFGELENKEKYALTGLFAFSVLAAFGAGTVLNGSPTGDFAGGEGLSEGEIQERMSSLADQQVQSQKQQLDTVANQSENISRDDLSIDSEVESVSHSDFGSLYEVNLSTTGTVPGQMGSGTQDIDETQTLYVSNDGRYLFQEPTDLEAQTQQTQQQAPQQPQQQPQAPAPQ